MTQVLVNVLQVMQVMQVVQVTRAAPATHAATTPASAGVADDVHVRVSSPRILNPSVERACLGGTHRALYSLGFPLLRLEVVLGAVGSCHQVQNCVISCE